MEHPCKRCGRSIPARRVANATRVGRVAMFCSVRCQAAEKQARYRRKEPANAQDLIHLRNLAAHGMIAEKILRDPRVIEDARRALGRWRSTSGETPALREWATLLESPDPRDIVSLILRVDEDGMRLRSSSPFAGALDQTERDLIFKATRR